MDKRTTLAKVARFLGISALADLGLLALVGLWCAIGGPCTATLYSERMFWAGLLAMMIGAPLLIGWLGSGKRPVRLKDETDEEAREDYQLLDALVKDKTQAENARKSARFALRMVSVGAGAIALSALIDTLFAR